MSTLLRTRIPILKHIPRVVFNKFMPAQVDIGIPARFAFKETLQMNYEEITTEMTNHAVSSTLEFRNESLKKDHKLIEEYWKNDRDKEKIIKKEILDLTHYNQHYDWNITNLVRKYDLSGLDVFLAMIAGTIPDFTTLGVLQYQHKNITRDALTDEWNKEMNRDPESFYVYFDWLNGIGVKNHFPIDIHKVPFTLDMRRFNDRNYNIGYERIFNLLSHTIDEIACGNKHLKPYDHVHPEDKTNYSTDNFDDFETPSTDRIDMSFSRIVKSDGSFPSAKKYYNRKEDYNISKEGDTWLDTLFPHDLEAKNNIGKAQTSFVEDLETYKLFVMERIEKGIFDLENYFFMQKLHNKINMHEYYYPDKSNDDMNKDPNYYSLNSFRNTRLHDLSIVNCLMFGKTNIRYSDVDKLLTLVRYDDERNNGFYNKIFIDNYVLDYRFRWDNNTNLFLTVNLDNNTIDTLPFHSDCGTKLKIAKEILQVMNEADLELLNKHNYDTVCEYVYSNDRDHNFHSLSNVEKTIIAFSTFS